MNRNKSVIFSSFLSGLGFFFSLSLSAQNYRNQQGIFIGAGINQPGKYSRFLEATPEPGSIQEPALSWETGFMVIRRVNPLIAFLQGISVLSLGNAFQREREIWIGAQKDSILFASNRQKIENYFVAFPFRWSFYLNQHSAGQWFIGPGISLAVPVFEVHRIRGNDLKGVSIEESRQGWPERGPYAFICPELESGFITEFQDCSLLRISLFASFRGIGILKDENNYSLQYYGGLRLAWFWGTD